MPFGLSRGLFVTPAVALCLRAGTVAIPGFGPISQS